MPTSGREAFLTAVRKRAARVAVGASTVRGSPKGTAAMARDFLERIELQKFIEPNDRDFKRELDRQTERLRDRLPERSWGVARKVLNIFLRDALYCTYLCQEYGLVEIEPLLEVPLDRKVVSHLRREAARLGRVTPEWRSIKSLSPAESKRFQALASDVACEAGCCRVHLDAYWWPQE